MIRWSSLFALVAVLTLARPVWAHAAESCAAPAIVSDGHWSFYQLASLEATEWRQEWSADGAGWVNGSRYVGRLEADGSGIQDFERWEPDAGQWGGVLSRRVLRFLGMGDQPLTEITFQFRSSLALPFTNNQRDVLTYSAQGWEMSDTRQDWGGPEGSRTWAANRRNVYERNEEGAFTSLRFERVDGDGTWRLGHRAETAFDEAGNRILCAYLSSDDASADPYLRYRSWFDGDRRLVAVVKQDWRGSEVTVDSTALVYDEGGRYQARVTYTPDGSSGWRPAERAVATFDDNGRLTEQVTETAGGIVGGVQLWMPNERTLYAYREDGLLASWTAERWIDGAWQGRYRYAYTAERLATSVQPDSGPVTLRLAIGPNPVADAATAWVTVPTPTTVEVAMFDLRGRQVGKGSVARLSSGTAALALDVGGLAPGVYFVRATADGRSVTQAMTVVR